MAGLAAAVVAVVGTQARVLQGAMGAGGGGAAAAVGVTQTLTVLLMDLLRNNTNGTAAGFKATHKHKHLDSTAWTQCRAAQAFKTRQHKGSSTLC